MRLVADYNLALAYRANRQPAEATRVLEDLTSRALVPGKESWVIAGRALDLAGSLASDQRDLARSLALRERALAAISRGPDAVERAYVERHLAEALIALKRPAEAIAPLERALAVQEKHGDSYDLGTVRFVLARALGESGRDRKRAQELATRAAEDLAKAKSGDGLAGYRKNVATFLRLNH